MTLASRFRSWLRAMTQRSRLESEMDAELRFHIEAYAQDLTRRGVPGPEAMRRSRVEFGGIERAKEECREARGVSFLESVAQDLRYAFRAFLRNPAFFVFAVAVLALGIGANTAIFSVAYNVLLRPLPYRASSRLVMVWEDASAYGFPEDTPAPGNFASWKAQNNVFADMAAMDNRQFDLAGRGNPQQFLGREITANMFPLLASNPCSGATFFLKKTNPTQITWSS